MSTKGGYAAAAVMPRQAGDRLYEPPPRRRYQQQKLLEQQQKQKKMSKKEAVGRQTSESVNGPDVSSKEAALSVPPAIITNLDRLMEAVTPFVEAKLSSEVSTRQQRSRDSNSVPFYYLEDLWESLSQWSVYGAGVSLLLNGSEPVEQFYVPSLSGIQLYMDKPAVSSRLKVSGEETDRESSRLASITSCSDSEGDTRRNDKSFTSSSSSYDGANDSPGEPFFQYLEYEQPYNRRPFSDKISLLASQSPELSKCRSSDLHPSSWMCVAWYPIYRIPIGSTLQDLDASFLAFHFLSTQPRTNKPALFHGPNSRRTANGIVDPTPRILLPVFGLASYKLTGAIVSPNRPHECEQEESLLQAADKWLSSMQVNLPDYQFFRGHYSPRR